MKKVGHIAVRVNVYHVAGVTEMTAFDKAWIFLKSLEDEEPICPKCGGDDITCERDCTYHRCIDCGYSELAEENS